MRYIDADALVNKLDSLARKYSDLGKAEVVKDYIWAGTVVEAAPTADVVDVVRCKDCQWYGNERACPLAASGLSANRIKLPKEDDFCSYGERRKDNG